ncbi:hypothetical protein FUA23_07355 [Neolewinella aurantiaca]|uniref:DUF378 domain-containing protein n=1 Tax=Neolewinella aurantiaca TaxID=2602767 RepID=A0A5C7FFT6_9BACT|nr:hypothetical protein [Neolewinella aurantiaca]TXF90049.1 hypothetical protein FUA23_07355 [Neolewinella aurantiaca]
MIKHATTITVIGFILLITGVMTLVLNLVGVDFILFEWIYRYNVALSLVFRFILIVTGFIMIYVGQTDWDREEA